MQCTSVITCPLRGYEVVCWFYFWCWNFFFSLRDEIVFVQRRRLPVFCVRMFPRLPTWRTSFFCFKHYSTFELEENSSSASSPFGLSVFLHGNRLAPIFPPIVFPPFSLSCLADWVVRIIRILSFLFPFLHARHYPSSQNIMIAMHNREIDFQVRLVPVGFSQV